jgi:hypothetical protein
MPVSPFVFFACLVAAFVGAMAMAWSQAKDDSGLSLRAADPDIHGFERLPHGEVVLESERVRRDRREHSCRLHCPHTRDCDSPDRAGEPIFANLKVTLLMVAGIILADAIGRVFYQKALNLTDDDNGFVTMFQNLEPAIAALI